MEIRVLRYFLMVVQEGNITKAAKKLLVTQPTLSKKLADLENELGAQLFIRGKRSIQLTEAGEYLLARANEMIQIADQTAANIQTDQIISGDITIGAGESIGMRRITKVIGNILKDYPDVSAKLISGNSIEMKRQLNLGTIDFAFFLGNEDLSDFNFLQLPEKDQWGILIPRTDPLSQKNAITPQNIVGHPLIVSEQGIKESRFQNWWGNLNDQMNIIARFSLIYNAQLLLENTDAYMFTFKGLPYNDKKYVFLPLDPVITEPATLVWKKNTTLSKAAQLVIKRLEANLNH